MSGNGGTKISGNIDRVPPEMDGSSAGGLFHYARRSPAKDSAAAEDRLAAGVLIAVPGGLSLFVGRDIEDQRRFAQNTRWVFLLGLSLIAAVGLAGSLAASRSILSRVDRIRATSLRIISGNLSERIPETGGRDELDRLSRSLNQMLERIERLLVGLTEVSDNIAHDLRTPLNRLRNRAEEALRSDGSAPPLRAGLEKVIDEADSLIQTFNALLSIARLEAGAGLENFTDIDLLVTVREAAELYDPVLEEAGLKLELGGDPGLIIRADRQLIGQMVTNLLDNACKYAGPFASDPLRKDVTVQVERRGELAILSIADHGPGIAPENRDRALRRFVRLEPSRSTAGSGLGLSLVAAVARLHGGTVELSDNEPGLVLTIALPVQPGKTPAR